METVPAQLPVRPRSNPWQQILPLLGLLILIIGGVAAYFLVQRSQEIRQQASIETTPTKIVTSSATGNQTILLNQKNTITFTAEIPLQTQITGIQYIAQLSGNIPADMVFKPATINGLNAIKTTLEPVNGGSKLTVLFLTTPPSTYAVKTSQIQLGTLEFTPTLTENLVITPDPALTKIIESTNNTNLISSVQFSQYSVIAPSPSSITSITPTPLPSIGIQPSPSTSPTVSTRPTPSPTPTASLSPSIAPTTTPIVTGRPTPTPTPTPTPVLGTNLCNQLCITDADCVVLGDISPAVAQYICYFDESKAGHCRLQNNPTSLTCQPGTSSPTPTPTVSSTPIATGFQSADINRDGVVDILDFSILNGSFLEEGAALPADIDGNGIVDLQDYSIWNAQAQL